MTQLTHLELHILPPNEIITRMVNAGHVPLAWIDQQSASLDLMDLPSSATTLTNYSPDEGPPSTTNHNLSKLRGTVP